jgi:general secretion pathway protein D
VQLQRLAWLRWPTRIGAAAALLCGVAGCNTLDNALDATASRDQHDPFGTVRNTDLRAPAAVSGNDGNGGNGGQRSAMAQASGPWLYPGEERESPVADSRVRGAGGRLASNDPGATVGAFGVELNFENADIHAVSRSILSDVLALNFVIDPRVQGTVTLTSVGPIPRRDVLMVFESALRTANAAVLRDGNILKIVPLSETNGSGAVTLGAGEPGFGVSVVPLRYTSATMMAKLSESFLSRPGALRADAAGNLVMIQGTMAEREAALDMIGSFDVEWLRNQSVGVYPLKATTPEQMIRELQPIFESSQGGRGDGVIRFQPVTRMNAVMAVAKSPKLLEQATRWVERLDRSDSAGTALRAYRLKYGDAKQIVAILNDIFAGPASSQAGETPHDQIAPGASTSQSRLDSLGPSGFGANSGAGTGAGAGPGAGTSTPPSPGGGMGTGGGTNQSPSGSQFASAFESFSDKKGADTESGRSIARGVLPYVRISADVGNNAVVVFSNDEDYRTIERALQQIDRPKLQVAIDATVAEIDLTDQLQYGVQYFLQSGNAGSVGLFNAAASSSTAATTASTTASSAASTAATIATTFLAQALPGANLLLGSQTNPGAIISALATLTNVKVLSAPSVVVLDNQPALLQVGDQIPIQTSTASILTTGAPIVNTISMVNTGVILKVLPHVHSNGTIQMEIDQEVSNVANPSAQSLTPTISDRRIHTSVSVGSSQTVLLGGLISDQDQSTKSGLPFLQNLQYVGALFGNTSINKQRTEIIIFIRPRLIRSGYDAQSVAEEFRERLDLMRHTTPVIGLNPASVGK